MADPALSMLVWLVLSHLLPVRLLVSRYGDSCLMVVATQLPTLGTMTWLGCVSFVAFRLALGAHLRSCAHPQR